MKALDYINTWIVRDSALKNNGISLYVRFRFVSKLQTFSFLLMLYLYADSQHKDLSCFTVIVLIMLSFCHIQVLLRSAGKCQSNDGICRQWFQTILQTKIQ